MDRRGLAIVGLCATLLVAILARGAFLSVGRFVLVALGVALVAGVVLLATRRPAYERSKVGIGTRVLRRPLDGDGRVRCTECATVVDHGEQRRFVREWVLLGVPLVLLDDGENAYCAMCADSDDGLATPDDTAVGEPEQDRRLREK